MKSIIKACLCLLTISLLVACGGGGGGNSDDFAGAARLSLKASPTTIDSGDRLKISVEIRDVHPKGIALKIRVPVGLDYVLDSGVLSVNGDELDISPTENVISDDMLYLVFYLDAEDFDESTGTVSIEFEGSEEIRSGQIEVDADVDDPLIDNSSEFDIDSPEFDAEDEVTIEVTSDDD